MFCRDDGRDSLKFYTDPGYFFELWFIDIQKDMENKKIELELKSRKKKVSSKLSFFLDNNSNLKENLKIQCLRLKGRNHDFR